MECDASTLSVAKWSKSKKDWCCLHKSIGCAFTVAVAGSAHYDCQHELAAWKIAWSDDKKDWCCRAYQRGCVQSLSTTVHAYDKQDRIVAKFYPFRHQQDHASPATATRFASTYFLWNGLFPCLLGIVAITAVGWS